MEALGNEVRRLNTFLQEVSSRIRGALMAKSYGTFSANSQVILHLAAKAIHLCSKVSAMVAASLVIVMSVIVVADVISRKFFNSPMTFTIELSGFLLALVAALGLAYTALMERHVSVDLLLNEVSEKTRLFISILGFIAFMFFAGMIAWCQAVKAIRDFREEMVGITTAIPLGLMEAVVCFSATLLFLVVLIRYLRTQAEILRKYASPWLYICLAFLAGVGIIFSPEILAMLAPETSPLTEGIMAVLFAVVLILAGIPIAAAIGLAGMIGIWYLSGFGAMLNVVQITVFPTLSTYVFTVLPLFVGTSFLAASARLSENLFDCCYQIGGRVRGGLGMATIAGCAGFAAISGDSMSTAASMGTVALPEMKRHKYKESLSTGCVAAGGTIGILIPPSIGFILYGMVTEQSIGKLFIAGVIPGLLEVIIFFAVIYILCSMNPSLGPRGPKFSFRSKLLALWHTWPVILLIGIVIGGLYSGFFTPTEAGAVGFFITLVLGMVLRRLSWKSFFEAMSKTVTLTSMIFAMLVSVRILNYLIAYSGVSHALTGFVGGLPLSRYWILGAVFLMYLILGCIMAIGPAILITLPLVYPVICDLGFDPIWFGVIMVIIMEMGMITPPFGLNVYVLAGVSDATMGTIFKGILPFIIGIFVLVLILILFPDLCTFLPDSMNTLESID